MTLAPIPGVFPDEPDRFFLKDPDMRHPWGRMTCEVVAADRLGLVH
jgi:hypothetical protein